MKPIPPSCPEPEVGPKYWRSLDELAATPGFQAQLEREFPEGASELDGVDRRNFMKLMAASFALGGVGLAGCRRPEKFILPYGKSVEGIIPGLPSYYATAMPIRKSAIPLLAETHQGRPTKVEGNPSYEPNGGASSLLAQASVLDLYDPDRAKAHTKAGTVLKAEDVSALLAAIAQKYAASQGAGLAILADESSSPTRARLVRHPSPRRFPRRSLAGAPETSVRTTRNSCCASSNRPMFERSMSSARRTSSFSGAFAASGTHANSNCPCFPNPPCASVSCCGRGTWQSPSLCSWSSRIRPSRSKC